MDQTCLQIDIPYEDDATLARTPLEKIIRKELGDFFEIKDYTDLIQELSNFFMYNNFIKQFILLTPIDQVDCLFLKVKDPYILTDLMFFMAIYHENKLKLESGGIDLD